MNCPVCGMEMMVQSVGLSFEVCQGCQGIWLDHGQVTLEEIESDGLSKAIEAAVTNDRRPDANRAQLKCPKCSIGMHAHKYRRNQHVTVDECYNCGGFFLDSGELTDLLEHEMSDAELDSFVSKMVGTVPDFANARVSVEARHDNWVTSRQAGLTLLGQAIKDARSKKR